MRVFPFRLVSAERCRWMLAFGLALVAFVLAIPASAYAVAAFSQVYPQANSTFQGAPFTVSIFADDASMILQTSKLEIDGVPANTWVEWPGHWEDPDCMENWIIDDYTAAYITASVGYPLAEGVHTVKATVQTQSSGTSTYTWSFTVVYPPGSRAVFSGFLPAAGTTVTAATNFRVTIESSNTLSSYNCGITLDGVSQSFYGTQVNAKKVTLNSANSITPPDGQHTLRATSWDSVGVPSNASWQFGVAIKPTLTSPIPVPSANVGDPKPLVAINVADNTPGKVTLRVWFDGVKIQDGLVDQGQWRWNPPSSLASLSNHAVSVDAVDAAGNTTTSSWTFKVVAAAPMSSGVNCTACHSAAAHPFDDCGLCHQDEPNEDPHYADLYAPLGPCGDCHGGGSHSAAQIQNCAWCHSGPWPQIPRHTDAQTTVAHASTAPARCTRCHDAALITEHAKYPTGSSFKYQCTTCHASADPRVRSAITAKVTDCSACHDPFDHAALHVSSTNSTCFGAGCHPATKNLAEVHEPYAGTGSERPQFEDSCALCHSNPAVNTATSGTSCTPACHSGTTHSEYASRHTPTEASSECTGCHSADLSSLHKAGPADWARCDLCHAQGDNWSKTADCGNCHSSALHGPLHELGAEVPGCAGSDCHDRNISVTHADNCDLCHESTDEDVVAAIASHDKACTSCHTGSSHQEQHAVPPAVASGCITCHAADLVTEHVDKRGISCSACHPQGFSGAPTGGRMAALFSASSFGASSFSIQTVDQGSIEDAVAAGDTSCEACHGTSHPPMDASFSAGTDYYSWSTTGTASGDPLSSVGANPSNPGVHANYQTTTAKCGICHSVHRAKAGGVKLLNTATATCGGCHIAGASTVTNVVIAWGTTAAPLSGPHGSSTGGDVASCTTRACHASSPHGAGGSTYALFRSKLLTAAVDAQVADAVSNPTSSGVTPEFLAGDLTGFTIDEADSVRTGYTCASEGCHEQTQLPVIRKNWSELREQIYPLGNVSGNQILKTGHLTGTSAASGSAGSYAPIAGCTSCHDQVDAATRTGYTFPHAQRATGSGGGNQTYLWYNIAGSADESKAPMTDSNMKSFDGACLKCHRSAGGTIGIGVTK